MLQFPGWHTTLTAPFYGLQTLLHNWQLKLGLSSLRTCAGVQVAHVIDLRAR